MSQTLQKRGRMLMIFAEVDTESRKELQAEMKTATELKCYRRLKIIDLSSQSYNVTKLAQMFDLSQLQMGKSWGQKLVLRLWLF